MSGTFDFDELYLRVFRGVMPAVIRWRERVLQSLDEEHGRGIE